MMNSKYFLKGHGEMIDLINSKDWSTTSLGGMDTWPVCLKIILNTILNSRYPKFLWWGEELVCFYNDAYRPSLGIDGKHPFILGMPAKEAWPEIWDIISPMINQVLETGEPTWYEDQLMPIYRNNQLEEVYWTFSHSPVMDEEGIIRGVMVTCTETTEKIQIEKVLEEKRDQLQFAIESAELGTWDYNPLTNRFTANSRLKKWFGLNEHEEIELSFAINAIAEKDRSLVVESIEHVLRYSSGGKFDVEYSIINAITQEEIIVKAIGKVWFDDNNTAYRFTGTMYNITEKVLSQREIERRDSDFRIMADNISQMAWIADQDGYIYWYNKRWYDFTGTTLEEMKGWGWKKVHHPDHLEKVLVKFQYSINASESWEDTFPIKNANGHYHWFLSRAVAIKNEEGKIIKWFGTNTDITREKERESFLEDTKERLQLALASTDLGTWEWDFKSEKIVCSDKYLEIFGIEKDTPLLHSKLLTRIHPDDMDLRNASVKKALETGTLSYQARVVWDDGTIKWYEAKGKVFFDTNNGLEKLMGTILDITDEKNYRIELEKSEQRFRLLANSMPQFVWTGDKYGNLNYFNQAVFDYAGLTEEQVLSESGWLQIVHPDEREENVRQWIEAVTAGTDFIFEHRFKNKDGEYRWQLSRAIPQKDKSGNIQMWVGTSTDIHEIKQMDKQKDYFISLASHELKTPVTSIKGHIELLQEEFSDSDNPFLQQSLQTLSRQAYKLSRLISDLLDITRIHSGGLSFEKEVFCINELILETVDDTRTYSKTHTIITNNIQPQNVFADRGRIGQVINNLLTNAIKYSPDANEVIVGMQVEEGRFVISIQDFGIGIDAGEETKIFDNFYRVKGKDERTFPGFGIGLYLVKEMLKHHDGDIWLTSEKNKGSIFYFSLPLYITA